MLGWAIALIAIALLLYVIEIFVPSGGLIGIVATLMLIGGIICLFWVNATVGFIATAVVLITAPFFIMLMLKMFPRTPVGKWLTMSEEQQAGVIRYDAARDQDADNLLGARGVVMTDLHPSGTCILNNQRIGCYAESGMILKGANIEVVRVNGMEITVRQV